MYNTEVPNYAGVIFRTHDFCVWKLKACASITMVGTGFDVVSTSLHTVFRDMASKRGLHQLKEYPWVKNVSFVSSPDKRRNKPEYLKWLRLIRQKASWKTIKYTRIRSLYFVKEKVLQRLFHTTTLSNV